jgi:hypothetical protein
MNIFATVVYVSIIFNKFHEVSRNCDFAALAPINKGESGPTPLV